MHLPCLDFYHRMSLTPLAGQRPGQPSLQATRRHFHIKVQRSPCVLCRMTCDHNTLTPLKFWCTWHMGGQACTVGGAKLRKRFCDPWWQRATKFPHFSGRSTLATQTDWKGYSTHGGKRWKRMKRELFICQISCLVLSPPNLKAQSRKDLVRSQQQWVRFLALPKFDLA